MLLDQFPDAGRRRPGTSRKSIEAEACFGTAFLGFAADRPRP